MIAAGRLADVLRRIAQLHVGQSSGRLILLDPCMAVVMNLVERRSFRSRRCGKTEGNRP